MLREMAAAAIRTSRLTKDYGRGRGLFDLDLQIPEQEVFGYLGPNGSGKTTTIRLLMGMIRATGGSAHTFGLDPLNLREFYALLGDARDDGATVFFSSHVLSEVEHVCDRVGILRAGKLVKVAQLDELRRIRVHRVEIEFAPDADVPEGRLRSASGVENLSVSGRVVMCTVHGSF